MNNQIRAGILIGCLNLTQSKKLFSLLGYEERKKLIESIVRLPSYGKEEEWEAVRECYDLLKGKRLSVQDDYKKVLELIMIENENKFAAYITSLVVKKSYHQN